MVQDGSVSQTVGIGVMLPWTISTPSKFVPAKVDLTITPQIVSHDGVNAGLAILPPTITIAAGQWQASFMVTIASTVTYGDYWIVWALTSDSTSYVPPVNTLVTVSVAKKYMIITDSVSLLFKGAPSVPIWVYSPEAAPMEGVGVALIPSEGVTADGFCINPGEFMGSFTVGTSAVDTNYIGTIMIMLDCPNAGSFYLASSPVLGFGMTPFDTDTPGLGSFVINNPKSRT